MKPVWTRIIGQIGKYDIISNPAEMGMNPSINVLFLVEVAHGGAETVADGRLGDKDGDRKDAWPLLLLALGLLFLFLLFFFF